MKNILASALLLTTMPLMAHDLNSDSCDVDLNATVKITKADIEFSKHGKSLYQISGQDGLIVNGEAVVLSSSQAALVADYSNRIRALVPEVKTIAKEGIALASEGVTMAFNELLGEGNNVGAELSEELGMLSAELDAKFSIDNGIEFNEHGVIGEDFFGEEFEERFEESIERVVQNSMGSLLIAVGQEMLFSGGDMEAFEARMEDFGNNIESQMEARAESLEEAANELCYSMKEIDELEEELKDAVPELNNIDVLHVHASRHKDI